MIENEYTPKKKEPEENIKKQTIETLINEEALLFAKYLRIDKKNWNPRIAEIN